MVYVLTAIDECENKTTITFTIEISKEKVDIITSTNYDISENNKSVGKVSPKTTLKMFKNNIQNDMNYKVTKSDGTEIADTDYVGTGYIVKMDNGKEYKIIVPGDINGDGQIKLSDLSTLKLYLVGTKKITGVYLNAADFNEDGNVKLSDLSKLKNYLVKN